MYGELSFFLVSGSKIFVYFMLTIVFEDFKKLHFSIVWTDLA